MQVKKVENFNFFFHPICLTFGIGDNFEILITKKPKLKLENNIKMVAIFYQFWPKLYQALLNNSITMAAVDVPCDWFVFKMITYYYILKVIKFEPRPTAYCFNTAEGRTSLLVDSNHSFLFRVKVGRCINLPLSKSTNGLNDQDGITDSTTVQKRPADIENSHKHDTLDNTSYFNSDFCNIWSKKPNSFFHPPKIIMWLCQNNQLILLSLQRKIIICLFKEQRNTFSN